MLTLFDAETLDMWYHIRMSLRRISPLRFPLKLFFLCLFALVSYSQPATAQQVKISGFTNVNLGSWNGSGDLYSEKTICVYNQATANYKITARGSGSGNAFTLSGTGGTVAYQTHFKESGGSYVELTSGSSSNFSGANTTHNDCNGSSNATFKVTATAAALGSAGAGSYSGTLYILLETR